MPHSPSIGFPISGIMAHPQMSSRDVSFITSGGPTCCLSSQPPPIRSFVILDTYISLSFFHSFFGIILFSPCVSSTSYRSSPQPQLVINTRVNTSQQTHTLCCFVVMLLCYYGRHSHCLWDRAVEFKDLISNLWRKTSWSCYWPPARLWRCNVRSSPTREKFGNPEGYDAWEERFLKKDWLMP